MLSATKTKRFMKTDKRNYYIKGMEAKKYFLFKAKLMKKIK